MQFPSISKRQRPVGNTAKFQSLFAACGQQERNANAKARDSCRLKVFPEHSHGAMLQTSTPTLLLKANKRGMLKANGGLKVFP